MPGSKPFLKTAAVGASCYIQRTYYFRFLNLARRVTTGYGNIFKNLETTRGGARAGA